MQVRVRAFSFLFFSNCGGLAPCHSRPRFFLVTGQPFDTIKVRLQTQPAAGRTARGYAGPIDCLVKTVRHEGPAALYKGSSAALASVVVENAVLFTANSLIKKSFVSLGLADARGDLTLGQHALAGGLAGVFSSTAICPAEVVKCNLQVLTAARSLGASAPVAALPAPAYAVSGVLATTVRTEAAVAAMVRPGPVSVARALLRTEGVRGLFKGLPSLWARDIPFNFAFLGSYEAFCGVFTWATGDDRRALGAAPTLAAGGLAGMVGWSLVFPMDVVKSRMQTSPVGTSALTVARTLLREEGPRALYRGCSAAVARAFPANAALLLGFELSHRLFNVDN
jgi:hypothetical protein